jgi:4-hydroxy-tetrahydrodipicolinate synthase
MNFSAELLAELLALPQLVGIKEGSWETAAYERTRRLTRRLRPDVAVMASGDEHLLACFAIGSDGSLVSLAAVIPELIVALDAAVRAGDLAQARRLNDKIYPLAQAVYADAPAGLVGARLKVCLALLGRITAIGCKAPVGRLSPAEVDRIAAALEAAGVEAAPRRLQEIYRT